MALQDLVQDLHAAATAIEANGTAESVTQSAVVAPGALADFLEGVRRAAPHLAHQCLGMRQPGDGESAVTDPIGSRVSVTRMNGDLVIFARLRPPA